MTRRAVFILTLLAVLLTGFSVALSRRDSRDWRANQSRRLFPFPWQEVRTIEVRRPDGGTLRFDRNAAGVWRIQLPDGLSDDLANQAVDELAALATLAWREPVREARAPIPERAVVLSALDAGGQRVELMFGEIANNLRAVTVDGDETVVFGVNRDLLKFLDWPAERFRKLTLASPGAGARPNRVVLSPGGDESLRIELRRADDGWRMARPVSWRVDETRLDLLLRWLDRLRADSIEAEFTGDLEWFGFTPESPFVEAGYGTPGDPGAVARRVEFGGDAGDGKIYVRETSRTPIFAISREVLRDISFESAQSHPELWRNFYRLRTVDAVGSDLPLELVVERLLPAPSRLTLARTRDRDAFVWTGVLEEAGVRREFAVEPPTAAEPMRPLTALLAGLSGIRVRAFLADAPPGGDTLKWTAFPAWRFGGRGADGAPLPELVLYAADAEGNLPPGAPFARGEAGPREMVPAAGFPERVGIAFSTTELPAVMEMHGELAYLLCLPPYRYQTRKLTDYDSRRWSRVEIALRDRASDVYTRKPGEINEQWWRAGDAVRPLMDDNNVFVGLLLELSQLRAEAFVAPADADGTEFGLDRPAITAIVYVTKTGGGEERLFSLTVGDAADAPASRRYARLDDEGPVFLLPGRLADALAGTYR